MTDAQIKHMVDRFLCWKLPTDFNPDGGIRFDPVMNKGHAFESRREPVGTNLLDATQADAMVRHMVEGLPEPTPALTAATREQVVEYLLSDEWHVPSGIAPDRGMRWAITPREDIPGSYYRVSFDRHCAEWIAGIVLSAFHLTPKRPSLGTEQKESESVSIPVLDGEQLRGIRGKAEE